MEKLKKPLIVIIATLIILPILLFILIYLENKDTEKENEFESQKTKNTTASLPKIDHIAIVVMENRSYEEIVGNKDAPYINYIIEHSASADDYYAITHPSLPNYIVLLGGSTFGIKKNCTNCFIGKTNLIDQLEKANISWKAYFESLPNSCFLKSAYPYTQKYNAFVYFTDIRKSEKRCKKIVPYSNLSKDLKSKQTTADFIWISPNLCHDTHYCNVKSGDKFLSVEVPKILNSPAFVNTNSLLIVTWDEAERRGKNHVPIIFIGKSVKKDYVSSKFYNHYSLLHTIESIWGLKPVSNATGKSSIMSDLFLNNE